MNTPDGNYIDGRRYQRVVRLLGELASAISDLTESYVSYTGQGPYDDSLVEGLSNVQISINETGINPNLR